MKFAYTYNRIYLHNQELCLKAKVDCQVSSSELCIKKKFNTIPLSSTRSFDLLPQYRSISLRFRDYWHQVLYLSLVYQAFRGSSLSPSNLDYRFVPEVYPPIVAFPFERTHCRCDHHHSSHEWAWISRMRRKPLNRSAWRILVVLADRRWEYQ